MFIYLGTLSPVFYLLNIDKRSRFNTLKAWQLGSKEERLQYRNELLAKGIDPEMCEYWDKNIGCIIAWENRPAKCKELICDDWEKTEIKRGIVFLKDSPLFVLR